MGAGITGQGGGFGSLLFGPLAGDEPGLKYAGMDPRIQAMMGGDIESRNDRTRGGQIYATDFANKMHTVPQGELNDSNALMGSLQNNPQMSALAARSQRQYQGGLNQIQNQNRAALPGAQSDLLNKSYQQQLSTVRGGENMDMLSNLGQSYLSNQRNEAVNELLGGVGKIAGSASSRNKDRSQTVNQRTGRTNSSQGFSPGFTDTSDGYGSDQSNNTAYNFARRP